MADKLAAQTPLEKELLTNLAPAEWAAPLRRTGVIARKIGIYPMWTKEGKKISATLLQVRDLSCFQYYYLDWFCMYY